MNINHTPKATCENYKINNYVLQDDSIPSEINEYTARKNFTSLSEIKPLQTCQLLAMPCNYQEIYNIDENKVLTLDFDFSSGSEHLVEYVELNVQEMVKSSIFIKFSSLVQFFHNADIRLNLADKSEVNFCIVCDVKDVHSVDLQAIKCVINSDCKLNVWLIDFAKGVSVVKKFDVEMIGDGNALCVNVMGLADSSQIDYNILVNVYGKRSLVDMQSISVLKGSDKNFKGTIDFKAGSKGSQGREKELCLPLDESSKSLSLPMILCAEEDVDISHSTSTGKMDDKALFYLNSRGIDDKEASKIYILSKLATLIKDLPEEISAKILSEIERIVYEN